MNFWREDNGQDLVEYSLLLVFFLVTGFVLFGTELTPAVKGIWETMAGKLGYAHGVATGTNAGV
jgi:Flp pilus assembly pilin Flp